MNYPQSVLDKVCTDQCYGKAENHPGWRLDPETKHWVRACGKPTLQAAVLECDLCEVLFVPKYYEKIKNRDLGAMCDDCDPPD